MTVCTDQVSRKAAGPGGGLSAEERVLEVLRASGEKTMEQLTASLPDVSWTQMFLAIDRLSRSGKVILRRTAPGDYRASLNRAAV